MWAMAVLAVVFGGIGSNTVRAQDAEQWKKMYEGALEQLKAAQERKNQLAAENERLGQQLEGLKKELAAAQGRLEELKRIDADHAEKTFFLRAHYMAWQQFIGRDLEQQAKWRSFLEGSVLAEPREGDVLLIGVAFFFVDVAELDDADLGPF
jgi:predicted nuclease with TOPRIM domain